MSSLCVCVFFFLPSNNIKLSALKTGSLPLKVQGVNNCPV